MTAMKFLSRKDVEDGCECSGAGIRDLLEVRCTADGVAEGCIRIYYFVKGICRTTSYDCCSFVGCAQQTGKIY